MLPRQMADTVTGAGMPLTQKAAVGAYASRSRPRGGGAGSGERKARQAGDGLIECPRRVEQLFGGDAASFNGSVLSEARAFLVLEVSVVGANKSAASRAARENKNGMRIAFADVSSHGVVGIAALIGELISDLFFIDDIIRFSLADIRCAFSSKPPSSVYIS